MHVGEMLIKFRYVYTYENKNTYWRKTSYTCQVCDNSFTTKSNLTRHLRRHTSEAPSKCEVCGKLYSDSSSLEMYSRMHTVETPYKCEVCEKYCYQKGLLI